MRYPAKDFRSITMDMRRDVYDNLTKFCEETGLEKTIVINRILSRYFTEYFCDDKQDKKEGSS